MSGKNPFNSSSKSSREPASKSPFASATGDADPAPAGEPDQPRQVEAVPTSMWSIAICLVLLTLLGLVGFSLFRQKEANDTLRARLADQARATANAEQDGQQRAVELAEARARIEELTSEAAELKREQEAASSAQHDLETKMRAALASKDVTISELRGQLTLSILDRILFDSGQAVIKPEGQDVLRKLAGVLGQFPGRQIHVTGHTDNVPIHTPQFPSNWELSAARALAAVRFLVEEAGVAPARLAAVASGEFQPVADNSTVEGRAQNRRIAIVVLPEVFAAPEAATAAPQAADAPPR